MTDESNPAESINEQALGANEIPSCHGGLENLGVEYDYDLADVEGELPTDIRGTFYRNGPGRQRIGDSKYGHWFGRIGLLMLVVCS